KQQRATTHPRSRKRSLGAGVTAPDDDHVKTLGKLHGFSSEQRARLRADDTANDNAAEAKISSKSWNPPLADVSRGTSLRFHVEQQRRAAPQAREAAPLFPAGSVSRGRRPTERRG